MTNRRCARGGKEKKGVAGVDAIVTHFSGCSNVITLKYNNNQVLSFRNAEQRDITLVRGWNLTLLCK